MQQKNRVAINSVEHATRRDDDFPIGQARKFGRPLTGMRVSFQSLDTREHLLNQPTSRIRIV